MIRYVPVQLLQHALSNRIAQEVRTLLYLKDLTDTGSILISSEILGIITKGLCISKRTFSRHIRILEGLNWIGKDRYGNIYLRRWKFLELKCEHPFTSRAEFRQVYLNKDQYIGYFSGAVISHQCRLKRAKSWRERKIGRSNQIHGNLHPISISFFAKVLKIAPSTAQVYRYQAVAFGFVSKSIHVTSLELPMNNIDIHSLRRFWPENSFVFLKDSQAYIRHPDRFSSNLHFKKFRR